MNNQNYLPSKKRSRIRILAGRYIFTILRYFKWISGGRKFCRLAGKKKQPKSFGHTVFSHKTPLFRKLRNDEQWMQNNKVHNLRLAVKKLDGIIINPGETFSYWKLIGAPTALKGYKKGMVLVNGSVTAKTGGGLCQLSNLLYWLTLHTPLTVTERYRHSFDVFPDSDRTQPFGSGATCVYNYRDLQIKNNSIEPFLLQICISDDYLCAEWKSEFPVTCSYRVYEKKHWITMSNGFYIRNNILHRECIRDGAAPVDEYITENHALMMYSPLLSAPQSFSAGAGGNDGS